MAELDVLFAEEVFAALVVDAVDLLELFAQNPFQDHVGELALPFCQNLLRCEVGVAHVDQQLQRGDLRQILFVDGKTAHGFLAPSRAERPVSRINFRVGKMIAGSRPFSWRRNGRRDSVQLFFAFLRDFEGLAGAANAFFSSDLSLRSTFLTSSAGGRFSGTIPRSSSILRTARLLSTCSTEIGASPRRFLAWTLTLVISAAKSLALMLMVGRKSANGRVSGTPSFTAELGGAELEQGLVALGTDHGESAFVDPALVQDSGRTRVRFDQLGPGLDTFCLEYPLFDEFGAAGLDREIGLGEGDGFLAGIAVLRHQVAGVAGEEDVVDFVLRPFASFDRLFLTSGK